MKTREQSLLVALIVAIAALLFMQTPLMTPMRAVAWDSWSRMVGGLFGVEGLADDGSITEQLQHLRHENLRLTAELADYRKLRADLGTTHIDDHRPIPAGIIGHSSAGITPAFVISRGTAQGVSVGDPVVVLDNVLVGVVQEARDESATVYTLLHPEVSLPAETVPTDQDVLPGRGLLSNSFQSALFLETIPRDVQISEGLSVVTAADESGMPYGLLIGKIESIDSQEYDAYQQARIVPPITYSDLSAVTVLAKP